MRFKTFGNRENKTIMLLHGGGLSWWSNQVLIDHYQESYHVVAVVIDGHGEDGENTFMRIENSAKQLIDYIDKELGGSVYALIGLSLGAQIIVETISVRGDLAEYAVVESALILPMKFAEIVSPLMIQSSYWLVKKKWFSALQAKELYLPKEMWALYYEESLKMSKQSLIHISKSNLGYSLKESIRNTQTHVLIVVGEKEIGKIKASAEKMNAIIPNSTLFIAENKKHGELSLSYPQVYIELIDSFLNK